MECKEPARDGEVRAASPASRRETSCRNDEDDPCKAFAGRSPVAAPTRCGDRPRPDSGRAHGLTSRRLEAPEGGELSGCEVLARADPERDRRCTRSTRRSSTRWAVAYTRSRPRAPRPARRHDERHAAATALAGVSESGGKPRVQRGRAQLHRTSRSAARSRAALTLHSSACTSSRCRTGTVRCARRPGHGGPARHPPCRRRSTSARRRAGTASARAARTPRRASCPAR